MFDTIFLILPSLNMKYMKFMADFIWQTYFFAVSAENTVCVLQNTWINAGRSLWQI